MNLLSFALTAFLALGLLVGATAPAVAEETTGRINQVLEDDMVFSLTEEDGTEHTFHLYLTGEVRINEQLAALADLNEGDEVTVTWEFMDGMKEARLIFCNR